MAAAFYSSSFLGRNSEGSPPLTHAVVPSVDLHVLRGTHAGVVAQRVVAGAGPADADVGGALVDVCKSKTVKRQYGERKTTRPWESILVLRLVLLTLADAGLLVEVVSCRTLALEAAKGVDAVPALAQTRQLLALVDVWRTSCFNQNATVSLFRFERENRTFTF